MAMNKFMHPRNPYKQPPDFMQMTVDYPDLRKYVKPDLSGKAKINFKCEGAVRELTKCLLHKDFGLTIDLPPNRLVPTLPLRMNYLLWIEDLLNEPIKRIHGVDIGTGASCIYPLLAVKHFNWKMTATEINEESIRYAIRNVKQNHLEDYINVNKVDEKIMLDGALEDDVTFDFCMCNPPFFSDELEMKSKARTDRRAPPKNYHTGENFELIAPGGETTFISRIIHDSAKLKNKIRVYTVMVGHKTNLNKVKEMVKGINPLKIRTTEFCQGRTTRWGLAWTFCNDSNLITTAFQPRKNQCKAPYRWVYPGDQNISHLRVRVLSILKDLCISTNVIENEDNSCGLCLKAYENTWSHSRRKRREEKRNQMENTVVSPSDSVVTIDSLSDSNNPISPSSPSDSIGYSSIVDTEEDHNNRDLMAISSNCADDSCIETNFSKHLNTNLSSAISASTSLSGPYFSSLTSHDDLSAQELNDTKEETSEDKLQLHETSPMNKYDSVPLKKRKFIGFSDNVNHKRNKSTDRPLLEAMLTISEFQGDIVFSLSYIDGVGGREAANQVFQYLKNKLNK